MNERTAELFRFYRTHRIDDQLAFYDRRAERFGLAAGQALVLSAVLLGFTTAAGALAGTNVGPTVLWSVLATALPAAATALAAYSTLYAFEQQSKIYADAKRGLRAAARLPASRDPARSVAGEVTDLVKRVEAVLRQEQAQWGQLTSQIEIPDNTRT